MYRMFGFLMGVTFFMIIIERDILYYSFELYEKFAGLSAKQLLPAFFDKRFETVIF